MILNMGHHQVILELVGHRGFGIIFPDAAISQSRLMIAVWWCLSVRVNSINYRGMATYND